MSHQDPTSFQRRYQRSPARAMFRVYSSLVAGSQLIEVMNLSKGGAFFSTRLIPEQNETVTCKVLDENWQELWSINGRVAWVNDKAFAGKVGFGVEFHKMLSDDEEMRIKALHTAYRSENDLPFGRLMRRHNR